MKSGGAFCLLLLGVTTVLASPVHKVEGRNFGPGPVSRDEIEEAIKHVPKETIRFIAKQMNEKIKDAVVMIEKMRKIDEPIREDMTPDPELMRESGFLMEDSTELSEISNRLPHLEVQDMHFLQKCIARAKDTDFDQFNNRRDLLNEVLRQVFDCAAIGMSLLESETNLDDLTDDQLTVDEIVNRMVKVQQMSLEFLHLGGFVFKFSRRVEKDFGKVSNNELVHGGDEQQDGKYGQRDGAENEKDKPKNGEPKKVDDVKNDGQKDSPLEENKEFKENTGPGLKDDTNFDKAVQELKRIFGNGDLGSIKKKLPKVKVIKDKLSNVMNGKGNKDGKYDTGSDSQENKKANSKWDSVKSKVQAILGFDNRVDKDSVTVDGTKNGPNDKPSPKPKEEQDKTGEKDGRSKIDRRQLLGILQILAKQREIMKRAHIKQ
ncbi:uncharacterized protein LOC134242125 [Saccostrea cucullata]|uniref:uncharacterized protein LOC134242125 n=1 Tax=Saccostrea cuccullata TaxID=36930 RepID=UPI002ED10DF1